MYPTAEARSKAVFLFDEPSEYQLKGCMLFWKNVIVYEAFIEDLAQNQEPTEIVKTLLEAGILKIASTPEELKEGLYDKIYYGMEEGFHNYLFENTEKIVAIPQLPDDVDSIVDESAKLDYSNKELKNLIDSIVYRKTLDKWIKGARESEYFTQAPPDVTTVVFKKMKGLADIEFNNYMNRSEEIRYHFDYRNKQLLEQFSLSSAICRDSDWAPFYRYKLGDFSVKNAETYLSGLEVVVPLMTKISIHELTLDEILRLRNNKSWNQAMDQFGELCLAAKTGDKGSFKERITEEILKNCLDAYKEEGVSIKKLGAEESKNALYTGISLIPIVGPIVGGVTGAVDPLVDFLSKRNKQKNLPTFLNDMRNLRE